MTDASSVPNTADPKPEFGLGEALSATFRTYFRKPIYFTFVALVGLVAIMAIAGALSFPSMLALEDALATSNSPEDELGVILGVYIPFLIVMAIGFPLLLGVITRSAITVKLNQGAQFGQAMLRALFGALPMLAIGLILLIPLYFGFLLFIVPGLFLTAMFYLVIPVIVFERKGLGAMGRSLELTRGYRWVLVGYSLVLTVITMLVSFAIVLVVVLLTLPIALVPMDSAAGPVVTVILGAIGVVVYSVGYAALIVLPYIGIAMAYVRLREIKEGGGDELLKVFE